MSAAVIEWDNVAPVLTWSFRRKWQGAWDSSESHNTKNEIRAVFASVPVVPYTPLFYATLEALKSRL